MWNFYIRKKYVNGIINTILLRPALHQDKIRIDDYLGIWYTWQGTKSPQNFRTIFLQPFSLNHTAICIRVNSLK